MADALTLGRREDGTALSLSAATLLRHLMALGASGSGKTVFCKVVVEEAVRLGLPAICIDPQGDLCSLGAGPTDAAELEGHGVDPALSGELAEKLDVVVFTPGSRAGVPLCANPVDPALAGLEGTARVEAVTRTAAVVVGRIGFDLDSDDGAGLAAVLDQALHEMLEAGTPPSLATLTEHLFLGESDEFAAYARLLDKRKLRTACQRLARLDVGARRALFHDGVPIDIDVLLGLDPRAPSPPGKTRVAVIYLNSLHQQEDKDFFVAALVDRLYAWMLRHPSADPQCLFYIDEVAPFIPPVRKPACKDGLSLLFKQARKYGVCCLMATQNPGDVDYRAMAQFGTWALGRLTTRQDLKKVAPTLASLAPDAADEIMGRLPSLEPGQLVIVCPDAFDAPELMRARWLATRHETWSEDRVRAHADPQRERFAVLTEAANARRADAEAHTSAVAKDEQASSPTAATSTAASASSAAASVAAEPAAAASGSRAASAVPDGKPPESASSEDDASLSTNAARFAEVGRAVVAEPLAERAKGPPVTHTDPLGAYDPEAHDFDVAAAEQTAPQDVPPNAPARPEVADAVLEPATPALVSPVTRSEAPALSPRDASVLGGLVSVASASVRELVERVPEGEGAVRKALALLAESGQVRVFQDGRAKRYWAVQTGGRPDLEGLPNPVLALATQIDLALAEEIAQKNARTRVLGLMGEDEVFQGAELSHRLVYKLDFEERVARGLLGRLFGESPDERLGSIYVHPHNLGIVEFSSERGLRFVDAPSGPASDIRDFDGVTEFTSVAPGTLFVDDADWRRRLPPESILRSFQNRFQATPGDIQPLFVPLWTLLFRTEAGSLRRLAIDGLRGMPVRWLPPGETAVS